ncbi:MAG: HypC/HybG/HupF family hydrogenase formation chaperone [Bryobacteraceae bacterium]
MCLAVPGRIVSMDDSGEMNTGKVQFGGVTRDVFLGFVPEAVVGDYVIVHVGFAISRVDEEEARASYELLEKLDLLADDGELKPEGGGP